jgi:hypothetical protein
VRFPFQSESGLVVVGGCRLDQCAVESLETYVLQPTFKPNGRKYGYIPDVDKSHAALYMDSAFMKTIIAVAVILTFFGNIRAQDTNTIFLTVDSKAYFGEGAISNAYVGQAEAATGLPESRPSELDPEGHWGGAVGGFQMSIRFSTNRFEVGVPIVATVLIRNAGTNAIILMAPHSSSIEFLATDIYGKSLLAMGTSKVTVSGPTSLRIPGHRQIRYSFDLGKMFNFTKPGSYRVIARRNLLYKLTEKIELSSAPATVEVVDSPR